jgi:hypothetical protein
MDGGCKLCFFHTWGRIALSVKHYPWLTCTLTLVFTILSLIGQAQSNPERGNHFVKKHYEGAEIPLFSESISHLPKPIMEQNAEWIDMYWKTWEIAFKHFKKPPSGSPFVSNILDEAFSPNIFQWDMIFMTMFARYGHDVFPAIYSLDNFYCRQHDNGYICREIRESDGSDFVWEGRKNTINPPLFSWAEVQSFQNTGDMSRFKHVIPVLEKYVEWLNRDGDFQSADDEHHWHKFGRRSGKSVHQLFWNTGLGSGMDNTPRGGNGWVDMSSQMVIQYNNLAQMSKRLGDGKKEVYFKNEAKKIAHRINKYCWNKEDGLYYDVDSVGMHVKHKTSGSFWPMLAGIASKKQCERLVAHLKDTSSFWRANVFPTLAADQPAYDPKGGYWLGSIWAPTNYMIIKGLELNGYTDFARQASEKYIAQMYCVFEKTKTIWENYSPEFCLPGKPAMKEFVGWSGIGPIALLIENVLGFEVNGADNELKWNITRTDRHGIENLKIGKATISAICDKRNNNRQALNLHITTDSRLTLKIVQGKKITKVVLEVGNNNISI